MTIVDQWLSTLPSTMVGGRMTARRGGGEGEPFQLLSIISRPVGCGACCWLPDSTTVQSKQKGAGLRHHKLQTFRV
jgi:hypothetical protein